MGCRKPKLTVYRVLRRCDDFDENLTGTRLRHIYETKGDPGFGQKDTSLLGGGHFLRTSNRSFGSGNYILPWGANTIPCYQSDFNFLAISHPALGINALGAVIVGFSSVI